MCLHDTAEPLFWSVLINPIFILVLARRSTLFTGIRRARRFQASPCPEALDDRCLLSGNVLQTNLVSDLPGVAQLQDPNLVNPWGISESSGSPFWLSDNNAGVSTLYNAPGAPNAPVTLNPLVVSIPAPGAPLGTGGTPTGTVFNINGGATGGFKVSGVDKNGNPITASAIFLFATEDGTLVGWNPAVNPTGFDPAKAGKYAIIVADNSGNNFTVTDPARQTGAVYKGLTIASSATPGTPIFASDSNTTTVLYAANFRSGKVEVYDTNFKAVTLAAGAFADTNLPGGYAPFNVQVLGSKVYVTYAKQDANKHDDVSGQGHGFVDVFNLDGTPGLPGGNERLVSRGPLDSPWGLALAPSSFGDLSGDLLVGNFGSGFIDVFNPTTGEFMGNLKDPDGEPIQIDGLWALQVGNGGNGGNANTVYFTAGLFNETHGLFGSLAPVAPGTPEGPAEQQRVTAFQDVFQLAVQSLNMDLSSGASKAQLRQDLLAVDSALRDFVNAEVNFVFDSLADRGGHRSSHRRLDDIFSILGSHDRN
ncbi:TIGR03118 family protein [Singulisphaera sp. GP187]|uniref:TIGR03118 family protein n=1 Tax=Singulisphaera sp. GP187 TaxID=1882752 RepID=UPI00092BA084|nr:TIGR03118 family protein [Singulisphaera sp. GP187]SIO38452.1 TIGR03118 family protein [Singulisphaera sp. GP187]